DGVSVEARACEADVAVEGEADVSPLGLARALERSETRAQVTRALRDLIGAVDGGRIGLPAVLGVDRHAEVAAAVADELGGEVFEVPTAPPSVPGIRLYRALTAELRALQARLIVGSTAVAGVREGDRLAALGALLRGAVPWRELSGNGLALATGLAAADAIIAEGAA